MRSGSRGSLRGAAIAITSVAVAALLPAPAWAAVRDGALTVGCDGSIGR